MLTPRRQRTFLRLIEILVEDWYVAHHRREEDLATVIQLGADKNEERRAANEAARGPESLDSGAGRYGRSEPSARVTLDPLDRRSTLRAWSRTSSPMPPA